VVNPKRLRQSSRQYRIVRRGLRQSCRVGKHDIPLLHICGTEDFLLQRHTRVVENAYHQLGGLITVIVKEGHAHHPHSRKMLSRLRLDRAAYDTVDGQPARFRGCEVREGVLLQPRAFLHLLKEEDTYATARGPGFTDCYDRYDGPLPANSRWRHVDHRAQDHSAGKPWVFTGDLSKRDATVEQALLAKGYHILIVSPMGSGYDAKAVGRCL